jgi:hypothetical protein
VRVEVSPSRIRLSFIGSAGVPNRYGGFESFLEHCGPALAGQVQKVNVTCASSLYGDHSPYYLGMHRIFLKVPANGALSVLHDGVAFFAVLAQSSHIVVLGVSGGVWFPLFRLLCCLTGKRLLVNVDGIEWRRAKFSWPKRAVLRTFDFLAQRFAHTVIYDNAALFPYLLRGVRAVEIAYSGDHVLRRIEVAVEDNTALTICRIEPENSIELLIRGALLSGIVRYTIVGNWEASDYGRKLRAMYSSELRLRLLDAIYDPMQLAWLRESCKFYLHGHSVGGTNPSLVEMLFYDGQILCLDVPFNRNTAGDSAKYFDTPAALAELINSCEHEVVDTDCRLQQRGKYVRDLIASKYVAAAQSA